MTERFEHRGGSESGAPVPGAARLAGIESQMLDVQGRIRECAAKSGLPADGSPSFRTGALDVDASCAAYTGVLPRRSTPYLDELLYAREAAAWAESAEDAAQDAYEDEPCALDGYSGFEPDPFAIDEGAWPAAYPEAAVTASGMPVSFDYDPLAASAAAPAAAAASTSVPFGIEEPAPSAAKALAVVEPGFFDAPPVPIAESMHRMDEDRRFSRRNRVILAVFLVIIVGAVALGIYAINGISQEQGGEDTPVAGQQADQQQTDQSGEPSDEGDAQGGVPSDEQGDLEDLVGGEDLSAEDPSGDPSAEGSSATGEPGDTAGGEVAELAETVTYSYVTDRYGEPGVKATEEVAFGADGLCLTTELSAEFSSAEAAQTFADTMKTSYGSRCLSAQVDGKKAVVKVDISSMARDKAGYEQALRNTVDQLTVLDLDPVLEELRKNSLTV